MQRYDCLHKHVVISYYRMPVAVFQFTAMR